MANWNKSDPTAPATFENPDTLKKTRESPRANRALCDYCFLGPSRSLEKLQQKYTSDPNAPTPSLDTLKKWSIAYSWRLRTLAFDEIQNKNESNIYTERYRSIIKSGLALKHERIEKLKLAYAQLEHYLTLPEFIWPRQVKRLPSADGGFEFVETRHFNAGIFIQLRGILADIARETNIPESKSPSPAERPLPDFSKFTDQEHEFIIDLIEKYPDQFPPEDD